MKNLIFTDKWYTNFFKTFILFFFINISFIFFLITSFVYRIFLYVFSNTQKKTFWIIKKND